MGSETPISDSVKVAASTGFADDYSDEYVPLEKAQEIERAANALREALLAEEAWRNVSGEQSEELRVRANRLRSASIAAFDRLKEKGRE